MAKAKKQSAKAGSKGTASQTASRHTKSTGSKPAASKSSASGAKQSEVRQLLRDVNSVVRDNPIHALDLLCRAWRMHRSVRIAELAELVEMRVSETPADDQAIADRRVHALRPAVRSVTDVSAGKAGALLQSQIWSDPRLAWVLLEFLAKPPWRSLPAVECYQVCLDAIVEARDLRIIDPLEELGARYTAVIPTSVGVNVAKRIAKAVAKLRKATAWEPLGEEGDALCDAIANQLGPELAKQQSSRARGRADHERHAEFLTAIYADPNDDAPRLVYADWLTEIGDERGELINVQIARAQGRTDGASRIRELELLTTHNAERWLGAIAPVVFDNDQVYTRGFNAYARLWKNKAALPNVVDDPAWATIETLAMAEWSSAGPKGQETLTELICGPRLRALRALVNVPPHVLPMLADRGVLERIERLEAVSIDGAGLAEQLASWLKVAVRPRTLSFDTSHWGHDSTAVGWLVDLPRFDQLERVFLASTQVNPASIARLEATALPRLRVHTPRDVTIELSRTGGATFERVRLWRQIPPSWLGGPRARIDLDVLADVEPYVRDRALVVDVCKPFMPGSVEARRPYRAPPSDELLAQLRAMASSVIIKTGWLDALPDMIWN